MKNTLHFCKVLTIENLLLSPDIHHLYLIETPQVILLQFLKTVDVICPKVIFQGQKTGNFCTEKPPFFHLQTTTGQYFCFAKTASPPDFFPVRIVVSPLFYACVPQRVISTTDSTCKEASINMNAWQKFPLVWLYFP